MKNENRWTVGGMMIVAGLGVLSFASHLGLPENLAQAAYVGALAAVIIGAAMVTTAVVKKIRG